MRTYLPKFHLGGLALSYKSNVNTKFALRVKSSIVDRYIDNKTIKTNSVISSPFVAENANYTTILKTLGT